MLFLVRTTPRGHGGQGGRPGLQRPGEEEDEALTVFRLPFVWIGWRR